MKQILTVFLALIPLSFVFGADSSGGSAGVSPYAYEIGKLFNLPLTNAILTTWVVSIIFILTVALSGQAELIPNKAQLVVETLIDGLKGLLEPILGKRLSASPLLGFFVFILIHNWSGLLPGIGVFGFYDADGRLNYWLRPASSDLMPL